VYCRLRGQEFKKNKIKTTIEEKGENLFKVKFENNRPKPEVIDVNRNFKCDPTASPTLLLFTKKQKW